MSKTLERVSWGKTIAVVGFALVALAGCRAEEQGRVIGYEQGVFKASNPDKPLSEEALADLRERTRSQGDGGTIGGAGAVPSRDNVRPPEASDALKQRMKQGTGN